MAAKYLFKSERLGFRNWTAADLDIFAALNADPEVMKHFPKTLSRSETAKTMDRFKSHYDHYGYSYYAVDILDTNELIGFIGMAYQTYESPCTPATDIGWRLKRSAWGCGYATEGAKRCLVYAFETLKLDQLVSVCTIANTPSENVMKKIGMTKMGQFKHPKLRDYPAHEDCCWYQISRTKHST